MPDFKHILVPLDGSELAERALEPAVTMAGTMGAEITLVRVVIPVYLWAPFMEIEPTYDLAQERNERETRAYLQEVRDRLLGQNSSLQISTLVLSGPVAEAIIDFATQSDIDLIVMSSHGRSGLGRWVYGSVAEKVLRGARCCSTLIVRGDFIEEELEREHTHQHEHV